VREILGVATGPSEAEPFWTDFPRSLTRRGMRGVKPVIFDAHEGLKAAASKVLKRRAGNAAACNLSPTPWLTSEKAAPGRPGHDQHHLRAGKRGSG
jgi:hypothetical protein